MEKNKSGKEKFGRELKDVDTFFSFAVSFDTDESSNYLYFLCSVSLIEVKGGLQQKKPPKTLSMQKQIDNLGTHFCNGDIGRVELLDGLSLFKLIKLSLTPSFFLLVVFYD